mmetsp:Transcript_54505/g.88363  ORF Transcript_54505/g.88363 Transcript_54505/m.88363 type:complete len:81 (+) Transcript_54505:297-539(+)
MHLLTDLLERRPDIDAEEHLQVDQSNEQKSRHETRAMCHKKFVLATSAMRAQAYFSKCIDSDHRLSIQHQLFHHQVDPKP